MALAHDIRSLRDRTPADHNTAHDYHRDTRTAWQIARKDIKLAPHSPTGIRSLER